MKVILLKNVPKVGQKYDIKNVSDGYALNFLIPHKLAEVATANATKKVEQLKSADSQNKKLQEELLAKNLEGVAVARIELSEKGNEQGHLFSSIHVDAIVKALKDQAHLDINPEFIDLSRPIKNTGEHKITVKVGDKSAQFTLVVNGVEA